MDNILPVKLSSPQDVMRGLAGRCRRLRLDHFNWSRRYLAQKSGVAESTIKRFESTGQITIENLVLLAYAMDATEPLLQVFKMPQVKSIDELEQQSRQRQRGRISD